MFCERCGTANTDGNKYCSNCGEPLIEDIVSDSRFENNPGEAAAESTRRYTKRRLEATREFRPKKGQSIRRRHPAERTESSGFARKQAPLPDVEQRQAPPRNVERQPRANIRRDYSSPSRALNTQRENAIYDYNDHFENNKYEKTQREPVYEVRDPRRRRSAANVPYIIVTYFTALVSLLNFAMPFLEWVRFQFRVDVVGVNIDAKLSPFEIADRLFKISDTKDLFGDSINNFLSWDVVPDFLGNTYSKLNAALAFAKIAVLIVFSVAVIGLVLYLVFFLLALFRRKSATGFGIAAAVTMLLAGGGFIFSIMYISAQTNGAITLESAPYQLVALSVVMIILISIMSVLRSIARRR